jgi:hypothetical protein
MAIGVAGIALGIGSYLAASKVIEWMGGDPEGEVMGEISKYQAMEGMRQSIPAHKLRQKLGGALEVEGAMGRERGRLTSDLREVNMGRRVTSPRELLESVSERLGTTPEELGRRLSPTRMGDYSSLSKAAFGRSAKKMGQ